MLQEIVEDFMLTIDPFLPSYVTIGTPGEATVNIVDDDRKQIIVN